MISREMALFLIAAWLFLSYCIVIPIDASPNTMKGGKYYKYFFPYNLYCSKDKRYGDNDDAFVIAQSLNNIMECFIAFFGLFCYFTNETLFLLVAIAVSGMTFGKTVLYFLMEFVEDFAYTKHNSILDNIVLVVIPNGIWIVVPLITMVWSSILVLSSFESGREKNRESESYDDYEKFE